MIGRFDRGLALKRELRLLTKLPVSNSLRLRRVKYFGGDVKAVAFSAATFESVAAELAYFLAAFFQSGYGCFPSRPSIQQKA